MKLVYCLIFSLLFTSALAGDDNLRLRSFETVALFEESIKQKQQDCLDESGGGSRAISCFISYFKEWDEELNYYYGKLKSQLNSEEKSKLKAAQLAWIKNRDEARALNSALMNKIYAKKAGNMFLAIRAGHVSDLMTPITKQRALLLKQWHEDLKDAQ
ncbi:MAG: lysozyme inhibitor LprI family protein [Leucothrix sp.]